MHPDLKTRHRLFVQASQSYTDADFAWRRQARARPPVSISRKISALGAPGSRLRQLYEDRDKALARLRVAQIKYDVARARLAQQ